MAALVEFRRDAGTRRLVVVDGGGAIAALAGVYVGAGWSSHVAEIRLVVGFDFRGRGVGRTLARAALVEAVQAGCSHVFVELIAEQEALVTMFQDLGFEPEALLADFVRDGSSEYRDLMILTHRVDANQARSALLGLNEVAQ
ncbi:GNAT family N-acetyltransferase [Tsukamurella sp. PLM1]|uniref:GNAT family N-acetyltransferase n=1 Tax=Tsukamurella sp. PLM1 TaxID=2929795 RepID=UPI00206101AA|nr:GNAT family N-acetyltransferase [Tsukamurella sp. PLM1]BDH56533.1 hypothetical protein MTP03_14720 [Tsukamurella sp. PLM1]